MSTAGTGDAPPGPLPPGAALAALAYCAMRTFALLARGRIHLPRTNLGTNLEFADGTRTRVFRETRVERATPPRDPCVLVVRFRLRGVRGRGHALFRRESLVNTVLFAGFPGLISKLWLAHDRDGYYRGLYEWDDPRLARAYVRALWWALALVSVPGSIDYHVIPGVRRDELLASGGAAPARCAGQWWQPARVQPSRVR
ncbi:hypothetical protein [Nocardia arizonensis]|uniref:hypothetical protein n=1 Tax=Nocardia arizonensis TaxID=1141647 RepID=UPI0006CFB928|nr:hypothetical protein [Nocardia arizonensis]